jgi:F0F1-type ATP synthase assembly protein I
MSHKDSDEERLRKLLGEPEDSEPEQDEFDRRLGQIGQQLDEARDRRKLPDVPEWDYKRAPKPTTAGDPHNVKGLGVGMSAGYTLVGCMIMGYGIGWLIDRPSGGTAGQAFGALGGCVVGMFVTIVMITRSGKS